nr:dienelactone hydrolase family protein [Acuticoccus kalidii]
MDLWASRLAQEGWASVIVDSHGPRGYDDYEIWRLICVGQMFMGSERAGDVLVSIDDARRMPFVDPERIALIGASHGGWSIMDFFALDPPNRLPFNLSRSPAGFGERGMDGIVASILVYPWCGPANRATKTGWRHAAPVLFLLSRDDIIAPSDDCLAIANILEDEGVPVETHVFEDVTHGFDQQGRSALSTLVYDPEATEEALDLAVAFLHAAIATPGASAR